MLKTATFAILHFSTAFLVAYLLTGSAVIGGAIALIEPAVNTVVFYFHEKLWNKYDIAGMLSIIPTVYSEQV